MKIEICYVPDVTMNDYILFLNDIRQLERVKESLRALPRLSALRVAAKDYESFPGNALIWHGIGEAVLSVLFGSDPLRLPMKPWLFAAHGAWQPSTRIVRYNKLWRSLEKDYGLSSDERSDEIEIESEAGIRYALCCELTQFNLVAGIRILLNRSSAIILSNRSDLTSEKSIREFFAAAFPLRKGSPDTLVNWAGLVTTYCPRGEVVIRPMGETDLDESSLYLIGSADLLERWKA